MRGFNWPWSVNRLLIPYFHSPLCGRCGSGHCARVVARSSHVWRVPVWAHEIEHAIPASVISGPQHPRPTVNTPPDRPILFASWARAWQCSGWKLAVSNLTKGDSWLQSRLSFLVLDDPVNVSLDLSGTHCGLAKRLASFKLGHRYRRLQTSSFWGENQPSWWLSPGPTWWHQT